MEIPNELAYPALLLIGGGVVGLWRKVEKSEERSKLVKEGQNARFRAIEDEVKSLRKSRHEQGNWIESLRADVLNLKHDVERLRDGKRNGNG